MKVFISWSKSRSKAVAEILDDWLQCVLQAVDPWMSSKDIDRGSLWFNKISDQLSTTNLGIVCLTKENKENPWILFESGALAKGLSSSRVCTLLIDLKSEDVDDPLAQFNHTYPTREGIYSLVSTINSTLGDQALREGVLEKVFDTYWPQFEERFAEALKKHPIREVPIERTQEDIMTEVLRSVRRMDKRMLELESSRSRDRLVDYMRAPNSRTLQSPDSRIREATNVIHHLLNDGTYSYDDVIIHCVKMGIENALAHDIANDYMNKFISESEKG